MAMRRSNETFTVTHSKWKLWTITLLMWIIAFPLLGLILLFSWDVVTGKLELAESLPGLIFLFFLFFYFSVLLPLPISLCGGRTKPLPSLRLMDLNRARDFDGQRASLGRPKPLFITAIKVFSYSLTPPHHHRVGLVASGKVQVLPLQYTLVWAAAKSEQMS